MLYQLSYPAYVQVDEYIAAGAQVRRVRQVPGGGECGGCGGRDERELCDQDDRGRLSTAELTG